MNEDVKASFESFDGEKLTPKEITILERKCGFSFGTLNDPNAAGSMSVLAAMAWVWAKRTDPSIKFDEFEDMGIGELNNLFPVEDSPKDEE